MINHKKLDIWKKGMNIVRLTYKQINQFPKFETYNLSSQMSRSAISIPSNIAEGSYRKNLKETIQFLYISQGSAAELETQVFIALDLKYILKEDGNVLLHEIESFQKMTNTFITHLKKQNNG